MADTDDPGREPEQQPRTTEPEPEPAEESAQRPAGPRPPRGKVKWIVLALVVLVSVGLDQWSKQWAQDDLQKRPGRSISLVKDVAAFTYVRNPGAAWGFLSGPKYASFRRPFFTTISIAAMIFILGIFHYLHPAQRLLMTALALIMSGAVGNFIDRLRYNYVVDFIDVRIPLPGGDVFFWPKFNIADIAITMGVGVLVLEMFFGARWERQRLAAEAAALAEADPAEADEQGQGQE